MGKQKLKGKDLRKIGYKSDKTKSLAINIMSVHFKHLKKQDKLDLLVDIADHPKKYKEDEHLLPLVEEFMEVVVKETFTTYKVKDEPKPYKVFGKKFIDTNTINQMDLAMRLPIAEKGALMPDAHVGYGLPIGGVIATKNEIIPYGIGLDIGCRMALTIFDAPIEYATRHNYLLKRALKENTFFGIGRLKENDADHEVLERPEFQTTELLKQLHGKAINQIGSSGSGNHFVEFGEVVLEQTNNLGLPAGSYLGLLSHSGSRGFGATIAQYYTKVAMDVCRLPNRYQHLAWLDMNKAEGQEYWIAMNLAGDYAKANHDVIHQRIAKSIGLKPLKKIENHHNFAWKEMQANGEELIVHRKGATPAGEGQFGIIPGSMSAPGFIVSGQGNDGALHSAAHGAGRKMSRTKAKNSITKSEVNKHLKQKGITLIGAGTDEAPMAYKNIDEVMKGSASLVNVEGKFLPKIVRMNKD